MDQDLHSGPHDPDPSPFQPDVQNIEMHDTYDADEKDKKQCRLALL